MTTDDIPATESTDANDHVHTSDAESVDTEMDDVSLSNDIIPLLASALLNGGETSDAIGFAVSAGMSGPLPPPWILEGYNETIPGGADRIMTMAEKGQAAMIADRKEQRQAERRAPDLCVHLCARDSRDRNRSNGHWSGRCWSAPLVPWAGGGCVRVRTRTRLTTPSPCSSCLTSRTMRVSSI